MTKVASLLLDAKDLWHFRAWSVFASIPLDSAMRLHAVYPAMIKDLDSQVFDRDPCPALQVPYNFPPCAQSGAETDSVSKYWGEGCHIIHIPK